MTTLTPVEIERRAKDGDPDAQYALSGILVGRHQGALGRIWLERAAAQGHADAIFTLAGALLTSTEGAPEHRPAVVAGLRKAMDGGSVAASRAIAALVAAGLMEGGGWPDALALMRAACSGGDAPALREIAAILLGDDEGDLDGAAMMHEAASGDALAAALLDRRRIRGRSVVTARYDLGRAFGKIETIIDRLGSDAGVDMCQRPRMRAFRGSIGADLCDHLIGRALPRVKRQKVVDADSLQLREDPARTAWGAGIGFGFADLPATLVGQKMALLSGVPYSHGEPLAILRYRIGQEYRPHFDFLGPGGKDLDLHGQRIRTALLYLNDGYEGGETEFLTPKIRFAGRTGDMLVFDNVDESGAPDLAARHAGRPVERGEKWLATLWFRDRPFAG